MSNFEVHVDRDLLRHEIDAMTPDIRETGPLDSTQQAHVYAAMVVHGMCLFAGRDDFPWTVFADEPRSRQHMRDTLAELRDELMEGL